jgi:ribonucleoside-diphosphate reductase alpha chain
MNTVKVRHRNGSLSEYDANLTTDMIDKVLIGLKVNRQDLIDKMSIRFDGGIITTRKIQEGLINASHELATAKAPDWIKVAGRLKMLDWNKEVFTARGWGYGDYPRSVRYLMNKGMYGGAIQRLSNYTQKELEEAGQFIQPERDLRYTIAGTTQLTSGYLCKEELLQEMYLTQALLLASDEKDRLQVAQRYYEYLSLGYISLATPVLRNLRRARGSLTSCFLLDIDDSIEGIFHDGLYSIARMSKNGGGVGVRVSRIRAEGSAVNGVAGASKGIVPWISLIDSTAVNVDQGGSRKGAVTVAVDVWHYDLPRVLEMKSEVGDRSNKAYNIFPQLIVTDEFCRRVEADEDWYLICPYEVKKVLGIDIVDLWGAEFNAAYTTIVETIESSKKLRMVKKVRARAILKKVFQLQEETGTPYIAFKDTINRLNPDKHEGAITHVNLCVAPNTKILTSTGYQVISTLEEKEVEVWNGEEWSPVVVKKTGTNQPLLQINLSFGGYVECTHYHKFHLSDGRVIPAEELVPGDKLIRFNLPVVTGGKEYPLAYTAGYCALATYLPEVNEVTAVPEVLSRLAVKRTYEHSKPGFVMAEVEEVDLTPPLNGYSIAARLDWIAGAFDATGVLYSSDKYPRVQLSGPKELLLSIRLLLQTLGVNSYLGVQGDLYVTADNLVKLKELGLNTSVLKLSKKCGTYQDRLIEVVSIGSERVDDTYCFTEHRLNRGMFNGMVLGNCVESYSNTAPGTGTTREEKDKTVLHHSCNLVSLNQAYIPDDLLPEVCRAAVRILDTTIDLTTPPTEGSRNHNARYRTIGVGSMGLADWLAQREINLVKDVYGLTDEAAIAINNLYEDIGYYTTLASCELAEERGAYPAFEGSEWSKGLVMGGRSLEWVKQYSHNYERWVDLVDRIKKYGIRNSHIQAIAPNTSSSLIQGVTASILPAYSRFYTEKIGRGLMKVAPPFVDEKYWFYRENKYTHPSVIVALTSVIQRWLTTGISMELLYNLNESVYQEGKTITSYDYFLNFLFAWKSEVKTMYYIRSIPANSNVATETSECTTCAN